MNLRSVRLASIFVFGLVLACAHPDEASPLVKGVSRIGITVGDLDRSVRFFHDVLTFDVTSQRSQSNPPARMARMRLGDEEFELTQYEASRGRFQPADSRSNDLWFQHIAIIVSDMDKAYAILQSNHVHGASLAPQRLPDWNKNAGGIRAYYFRDPDDHFLEILQFPPDKGLPRWHSKSRLFLGIDHTAIVVSNTVTSLRYYRELLGMKVVGTSENYGKEQEALNNVPGAHLRITTLRAANGPGIELLEYVEPRNGRAYPKDARPMDLFWWQTTLICADPDSAIRRLCGGQTESNLARDPDGHVMQLAGGTP